jgi:protein gp37
MRLDVWGLSKDRHRTKTWSDVPRWNRKAKLDRQRKRVFCASLADVFEDHAQANEIRPQLWDLVRQSTWLDWLILTKRPENISSMLPPDWGQGWRNVWLGVTVEDDRVAGRLDDLRSVPSVIRFVSYEPALGPLDHSRWARAMRSKCQDEGIAFFFKQSSGRVSGRGIELDGQIIQQLPAVKEVQA